MNFKELDESQFVDMFADTQGSTPNLTDNTPKFGAGLDSDTPDIFASTTNTTTLPPSTTETTTLPVEEVKPLEEVDILGGNTEEVVKEGEEGRGPGRPPKYDFSDLTGYYKNRVEAGTFAPIKVEDENGNEVDFLPTTPEEMDDAIDMQVDHRFQEAIKDVDNKWYESKPAAWQFVAKYAENLQDPTQLIPFLTGVQQLQTVANIDETQIEGAEQIVRMQLGKTIQDNDLLDMQIEALKTTNKILDTAAKFKPAMVQAEQQNLVKMQQAEQQRIQEWRNTVIDVRNNAIQAIEAPVFGKEKLKQEEKAAVYELIAVPDEQAQGYSIFNKIDELFEKKDFAKLTKIALLLTNEESYNKYISTGVADATSEKLQRKLRISTESKAGGKDTQNVNPAPVTTSKPAYKIGARFGRG